jgi:hypothetical protein
VAVQKHGFEQRRVLGRGAGGQGLKGGTGAFSYTLDEPAQGSVGVRLLLGPGGWCAEAPAKTSGTSLSTARNDTVDKFVAEPKSPAPATCPGLPEH